MQCERQLVSLSGYHCMLTVSVVGYLMAKNTLLR